MPKQEDLANAEKKLQEQLRKIRLAKKGLPADGSVVSTQAEVAKHFKVQRSTVHTWLQRDDFPCKEAPFSIRKIEQWRESQRVESELMDSDADSPWLERLRQMKALQEEIKLEQLRGGVVEVDRMRDALARLAGKLYRVGELLGARYGAGAAQLLNDVLEEWESTLSDEFDSEFNDDENRAELAEVDGGEVASEAGALDERMG